jgi:hypothetical protein
MMHGTYNVNSSYYLFTVYVHTCTHNNHV